MRCCIIDDYYTHSGAPQAARNGITEPIEWINWMGAFWGRSEANHGPATR